MAGSMSGSSPCTFTTMSQAKRAGHLGKAVGAAAGDGRSVSTRLAPERLDHRFDAVVIGCDEHAMDRRYLRRSRYTCSTSGRPASGMSGLPGSRVE